VLPLRSSDNIQGSLLGCLSNRLSVIKLVRTTPQTLLVQFLSNFTGKINKKFSCAYHWHFLVQWFLSELWPLIFIFKFVRTTSLVPLKQFLWNCTGLICSSSTCAYSITRIFLLNFFLPEIWLFNKVFFCVLPAAQNLVETSS
jgi:hypothetical protein